MAPREVLGLHAVALRDLDHLQVGRGYCAHDPAPDPGDGPTAGSGRFADISSALPGRYAHDSDQHAASGPFEVV
jgi:hypothetical protein